MKLTKFAIIGTGVVGTALAVLLEKAGLNCIGVNTRSQKSYQRFCRYLPREFLTLEEISGKAELVFITTQDDVIAKVSKKLSECSSRKSEQFWIHCSGSLPSSIMEHGKALEVGYLSIHPLQAFASIDRAINSMAGVHFGIEGNNQVSVELAEKLVKLLKGIPHEIDPTQKSLYHAGAVVASNYLVSLTALSVDLLREAGMEKEDALRSLLPLMDGAYRNILSVGLAEALLDRSLGGMWRLLPATYKRSRPNI